jgi:anti-sigma-K factor RskA
MNEHVDELLALYALGGMEAEESRRIEAHLAECADCRNEAEADRALVGLIAQAASAQPRDEVRARLLQRIETRPRLRQPAQPAPGRRLSWVLATLSAVVVVALVGWNISLNRQFNSLRQQITLQQRLMYFVTSPTTEIVELAAPANTATASGRAYIDADSQMTVVVVRLRPLKPDQTYQAWIMGSEGPKSAGLFRVNEGGWGMTTLTVPYSEGSGIGISLEPAGGSDKPTEVVLAGGR